MKRKAILLASFGVIDKDVRKKTLDKCEQAVREKFPHHDFFRTYTSERLIEKIREKQQVHFDNLAQVLQRIYEKGYEEVLVQSLHIVCGSEYQKLEYHVEAYRTKFKKIVLGQPLLANALDYTEVATFLKGVSGNKLTIFVGHGTSTDAQMTYSSLENALRDQGVDAFVGTIKGHSDFEQVIFQLEKYQVKTVVLRSALLAAGHHATKDLKAWKCNLEQLGYEVEFHPEGLGEYPWIQQQFATHSLQAWSDKKE